MFLSLIHISAAIFSEADHQTVYAKAVHERRYPASLTKIMTCLVALKNGNLDEMVTVGDECRDIDVGSSVCEIDVYKRQGQWQRAVLCNLSQL